jgi:hypothetical protein
MRLGASLGTARTRAAAGGNRLEALKGDRVGQHSIRINDQFRVCFRLCRFFGLSDGYWLRTQAAYDTQVARGRLSEALGKIRPWCGPDVRLGRTA